MSNLRPLFQPVTTSLDWADLEAKMLQFWEENQIFQKLQLKLKGSKDKFSFIDGPITANNPMGVHTARGRTLKDVYQRYWAMRGYNQRFQNGFDTQGLWVEVEVERSLGLNSKQEILGMGLEIFVDHCKSRVEKYSEIITDQSRRLGQQMDWDTSYFTHADQNIEHIWHFLKKCHINGWIYQSRLVMPWCPRCSTSLSAHEMADSYRKVTHPSVFLQLPVEGATNRYFLVWTTTPWTLLANTALAIHPELTYLLVEQNGQEFYLAEDSIEVLESNYSILETQIGVELLKLRYKAPFSEVPLQNGIQHKIVPWEEVSSDEGTGIVHVAPGCGAEDFELGKQFNLGMVAPINERGELIDGLESFSGLTTLQVANPIFESLAEKQLLYKVKSIEHRYPVCWRCKTELVFKLEKEWFISCDEIRPQLQQANKTVKWVPEHAGKRMHDWLENMSDWCISRKRYWGLPLPFYPCDCGQTTVVGSLQELRKLAKEPNKLDELPELHRPWIDELKIKCPQCGKVVKRISEVGDCWLDAGIVPFSTLNYLENREKHGYWQEWFPAELVCEMIEQVRLWFYSQLFMSVTLEDCAPFKTVVIYEEVRNEDGSAMHKSSGNAISLDEALKRMGADVLRWNYATQKSDSFLRFGYNVTDEVRRKFVPFWNAVRFFVNFAALDIHDVSQLNQQSNNILDQWILVRLNQLIEEYHTSFKEWDIRKPTLLLEEFFTDLTNWYVRSSRRRFWKEKDHSNDKDSAYATLYKVLLNISLLLAPFMPFLSDHIFQLLRHPFVKQLPESVHLCSLPDQKDQYSSNEVLESFKKYQDIVEIGRTLRNNVQIKLRQPLSLVIIVGKPPFSPSKFENYFSEYIMQELNVKEVKYVNEFNDGMLSNVEYLSQSSKEFNYSLFLVTELTIQLRQEGIAREIVRVIQRMRKEADLDLDTQVNIKYETDSLELSESLELFKEYVKTETLALDIFPEHLESMDTYSINGAWINLALDLCS